MLDRDLEDTKPIQIDEEVATRSSRTPIVEEEDLSRSEKYRDVIEEDERELLAKEDEERYEEELAERNINEAEKLLEEEVAIREVKPSKVEFEDDDEELALFVKFKKLPKKTKIIIISLIGLFLILLIVFVTLLVMKFGGGAKKPVVDTTDTPAQEEHIEVEDTPPEIIDNYYYKDGSLYLLDSSLNEIGTYECENQDENLCYVAYNNNTDVLNTSLLVREDGKEVKERLPIISKEFVFINDSSSEKNNNINLYSISEGMVKGTYKEVKKFDKGYVIVKDTNNKYGLLQIDDTLKVLLSNQYDYLGMINNAEFLVAKNSKGYYLIDRVGKAQSSNIPGTVKYYSNELIVTNVGKEYSVYDLKGNMLESGYEFATVTDKYMALVKEDKVYVKDKDGNKYHEDGIPLKNNVYVKTYTYDEENKLLSSKASFALNSTDRKMELVIYEKDLKDGEYKQFNMKSPEINGAHKYMNYFDDKLYFYSDEEKNTVIGTYTCTNKNLIGDETTLDYCYPAMDTVYEENVARNSAIPIINQRFVFIKDGQDVVLYDMKNRKKLVSYTSVNTYTPDNKNTLSHFEGNLDVIALNKKGQYGMITITSEGASTSYKFQYNKLERLKDYVIGLDTDNKWVMIFDKSSTSGKFPGKIIDYNKDKTHYVIKVDGNYYVYKVNGDIAISTSFKEIIFNDEYFVGIDKDSKLNIYNYSGELITDKSLDVSSYTCSLDTKYKVVLKNKNYNVSVCDGDKYKEFIYSVVDGDYLKEEEEEQPVDKPESGEETETDKTETDNKDESSTESTEN